MSARKIIGLVSAGLFSLSVAAAMLQSGCQGQWPQVGTTQKPAQTPPTEAPPQTPATGPSPELIKELERADSTYKYVAAKRYTSPIYGLSICPPEDMERDAIPTGKGGIIALWSYKYPPVPAHTVVLATNWALKDKPVDLNEFVRELPAELTRKEQFQPDAPPRLDTICGKPVVFLSGRTGPGLFLHQAWVLTSPLSFLVVSVTGTEKFKLHTQLAFQGVMNSLQISDPGPYIATVNDNISRGAELLKNLDASKIAAALPTTPEWFLIRKEDKDVGFMLRDFNMAKKDNVNGFSVIIAKSLNMNASSKYLSTQEFFSTPNRFKARDQERFRIITGPDEISGWYVCLQVDDLIKFQGDFCRSPQLHTFILPQFTLSSGNQANNADSNRPILIGMGNAYLPKAMAALMPSLIDLKQKVAYSFAVYSGEVNNLDLFTLKNDGEQNITIEGKVVRATKLIQQDKADSDECILWIDSAGKLLRMLDPAGFVFEKSSEQAVLSIFPTAKTDMSKTAYPETPANPRTPR